MKKAALVLDDERWLRAAATKSLREFVRQAFNIVVPAEPFMASWHTDSICDHLEALRRREIRNLLITMPPRHLKSTIVSVLFPPGEFARHFPDPSRRSPGDLSRPPCDA